MRIVQRVRQFNRTWTEVLGLLDQGLLETDHSLAEARVIFELAQRESWERQDLRVRLDIELINGVRPSREPPIHVAGPVPPRLEF